MNILLECMLKLGVSGKLTMEEVIFGWIKINIFVLIEQQLLTQYNLVRSPTLSQLTLRMLIQLKLIS